MELPGPVALLDGECVICHRSARHLMERPGGAELHYAPLQGETAAALRAQVPGFPDGLGTFVLAEPDRDVPGGVRLWLRTDAILRSLELTGDLSRMARVVRRIPRPLRDAAYAVFVRFRYRLFGRKDHCSLPTPTERTLLLP